MFDYGGDTKLIDIEKNTKEFLKYTKEGDFEFLKKRRFPFKSEAEIKRLKSLCGNLQVLALTTAQLYPCFLMSGYRSISYQKNINSKGNGIKAGMSSHNAYPSYGMDLLPRELNKNEYFTYEHNKCTWFSGKVMALADILFGQGYIRCGADWKMTLNAAANHETTLYDPCHFEVALRYRSIKPPYNFNMDTA